MHRRVWLLDLDDTLHDASDWVFGELHRAMGAYVQDTLSMDAAQADALRQRYWQRYGATLLGLVRHHGVDGAHFLRHTHQLPGLEARLRGHAADAAALARLPGRRVVLTNAPRDYALRVLRGLDLARHVDAVWPIESMRMFGHWRPKPDVRTLRRVARQLGVPPARCVLVDDTRGHLKAAHRLGMGTVWMRGYGRRSARRVPLRPPYVDVTVRRIGDLCRRRWCLPAGNPGDRP